MLPEKTQRHNQRDSHSSVELSCAKLRDVCDKGYQRRFHSGIVESSQQFNWYRFWRHLFHKYRCFIFCSLLILVLLYFTDEKTSFENLIYQLFEFIQVLKEKNKFKATIKKAIDELCYFAILYMQINDDQVGFRID